MSCENILLDGLTLQYCFGDHYIEWSNTLLNVLLFTPKGTTDCLSGSMPCRV
jgi:hypothetical protein